MSIKLMTVAWELPIPSGQKMVLLSLCDNANDQGECYPSIPKISKKCSMSERSIFSHIDWLEKNNVLFRENRKGRSSIYHLHPCKYCTPANIAPTPANIAPTPANIAPITITKPLQESSKEPSIKPKREKKGVFVLPDWIPEETWKGFDEMRKSLRKPMTLAAMNLIVSSLEKLQAGGENVQAVLEQSIMNSWQGVFPIKSPQSSSFADKKEQKELRNKAALEAWANGSSQDTPFIEGEFNHA